MRSEGIYLPSFGPGVVSSDICRIEVDGSLSLIKAVVRDFSGLKERFTNAEKGQDTARSPDRLSLTQL